MQFNLKESNQEFRRLNLLNYRPSLAQPVVPVPTPAPPPAAPVLPAAAPPPRKIKPRPAIPRQEELDRFFLAASRSVRDLAIFRVMFHAGLRASEIGLLDMSDYSPRTGRLMVFRRHGSFSGLHPLNREESRALKAWLKLRGPAQGPLFLSSQGKPISRQTLDVLVKRYAARAGWPPKLRHCHSLKHACCSQLLKKGFPVEQVQHWVGHAKIESTMVYSHVSPPPPDQMAKALVDWK